MMALPQKDKYLHTRTTTPLYKITQFFEHKIGQNKQ